MHEVMERYEKIAVRKNNIECIQNMIRKNYSKESILELDFTEDEYREAEEKLIN